MLSNDQQQYVYEAIVIQNRVKYNDFFDEIYDHYISGIEVQMTDGKSFEEAFETIHNSLIEYKYSNKVFLDDPIYYYGLEAMQAEYYDNMKKAIGKRHIGILKGYFSWPTIVSIFLIGLLTYLVIGIVPRKIIVIIFLITLFTPIVATLPYWFKVLFKKIWLRKKLNGSVKLDIVAQKCIRMATLINIFNIFNAFNYNFLKETSLIVCSITIFIATVYAFSLIHLYQEQFKVRLA